MRVFKSSYKDRKGKTVRTETWYVEFSDHKGDTRRVAGFTSKAATTELGRNLEKLAAYARATGGQVDPSLQTWVTGLTRSLTKRLTEIGLLKADRVAVGKPVKEHVADYAAALKAKGNTEKHVQHTKNRIERVLDGCGVKYYDDLSASRVQAFLNALRAPGGEGDNEELGISAQTFNYYLGSMKAFCRWMVKDRRSLSSPLSHLEPLNVRVDRRYERRALTEDELRRLMRAAMEGEEQFGRDASGVISWRMSGPDRAMLYRLAVETGLRAGELRSLTPNSFDLSNGLPTVTVLAAYSKHRRDDTLPLLGSTAAMLREYLAEREAAKPVFSFPRREELAKVLRVDLEAAKIPHRDGKNRLVDFHALRHTFITNLAQGGVHPKTAQALARHSTITLTMDRYSHTGREQEVQALSVLPDLSTKPYENGQSEEDEEPSEGGSVSADCLTERVRPGAFPGDRGRLNGKARCREETAEKHGKNRNSQLAPVGFEPTRPDEGQRILSPLRLPFRHGAAAGIVRATAAALTGTPGPP